MRRAGHKGSKHGISHLLAQGPHRFEVTFREHSTQDEILVALGVERAHVNIPKQLGCPAPKHFGNSLHGLTLARVLPPVGRT